MKQVPTYNHTHPMVAGRTGDPARGSWTPKEKQKPRKRGQRRGRS
jgi:hypothetical protein